MITPKADALVCLCSAPVSSLDVCSEAGLIVSCSDDFTCRAWRLHDARSVAVIQHDAPLHFIALDHPSETIVTVCQQVCASAVSSP